MEFLIQVGVLLVLLAIGLLFGRAAEKRHFNSLKQREADLRDILVFAERLPPADREYRDAALVVGSVVLGEDYFKRASASLKSFFGGRLTMYESLMDRGRREAILRMKEDARTRGATMIFNVRFETSSLADGGARESPVFSAEFMAYGTALVPR
jgi:uncharacterized protein YbjQ (UPF0145 family)